MTMGTPNCAGSSGLWPPAGNKAAADKGDRGQGIDRCQFADGVEQNDLAGLERLDGRIRAADFPVRALTHGSRISQATRRRRQTARDGAARAPGRACGSACKHRGQASSSAASSPSSVLPATRKRRPGRGLNSRVASASCAARTSNFRLPATVTRSGTQPIAI